MDTMIQDIRYAVRMLRKAPGATAVALVSLAIGISVNTTVFSWVRSVLLNPLPGVAAPGRLVTLETVTPSGEMIDTSYPDFRDYRDRARLLEGVIAFKERPLGMGEDARSERVWALMVSGNYFDVLGVRPELGRFFKGAEQGDVFDAAPVAILGHALWVSRFNADPAVIGRTIRLNRRRLTIVGVAPASFYGTISGLRFDLYVPLTEQAALTGGGQWLEDRGSRPLYLFARLKPGVSLDQGRAEVRGIAASIAAEHGDTNQGISATLLPMSEARRGVQKELGALLRILFALGGLVLLIVCANLTNLQLARATTRQREIAVRLGLGASRGRVVRQLVTESVVLALLACACGVLASAWMVDLLRLFLPFAEYPIVLSMALGPREMAFAAVLSLAAAFLVGLAPAIRVSAARLADALKAGGRQASVDARTGRVRRLLVVGEVALAMTALVSAGLLIRSFENARRVSPGFDPDGVLLAGINLSTGGYDRERGVAYLDRVLDRVSSLPGVTSVALSEDVPLGFSGGSWEDVSVDGYVPPASENMKLYRNLVDPGYFDLMRIPLVAGRDFRRTDDRSAPLVAIVNQTFAARYFGGGNPIGRTIHAFGDASFRVVGVARDSKYHALNESPQPYFYVPLRQHFRGDTGVALHVRSTGNPAQIASDVRRALGAIDPQQPAPVMTTLADYISESYFTEQMAAELLAVLAALALGLASIGLYSLIAFGVSVRRQEIGVRMALGAASADILRLIVGDGMRMALAGVGAGLLLALVGARALAALLFGVSAIDLPTLAGATVLLALVAMLASYVPARNPPPASIP